MSPKVLFDLATLAGPAAIVGGIVGFAIGIWAYEASCPPLDVTCTNGGDVFGMYASSQQEAGFLVGGILAVIGFLGGLIYKAVQKPESQ